MKKEQLREELIKFLINESNNFNINLYVSYDDIATRFVNSLFEHPELSDKQDEPVVGAEEILKGIFCSNIGIIHPDKDGHGMYSYSDVIKAMHEYHKANSKIDWEKIEVEFNKKLDSLPYTPHVDDGQYNDGLNDGFALGHEWTKQQIATEFKHPPVHSESGEELHFNKNAELISEPQQPKEVKSARELIYSIQINKANLDNISEYKRISGTLLTEIERVMKEYANQFQPISEIPDEVLRDELIKFALKGFKNLKLTEWTERDTHNIKAGVDKYLKERKEKP